MSCGIYALINTETLEEYIGKIEKVRYRLQPVADGVKAKRFTA